MKPLKQSISITLDENVVEEVRRLAEECDRSVSQYINIVLKKYIAGRNKNGKSEKPAADAEQDL